jgi:hypothetical protein
MDKLAPLQAGDGAIEIVAALDENDFERARAVIPDIALYADYQDWLDDRFGLTLGLCAGGADARMRSVRLSSFLIWCRFANASPSQEGLDEFAALAGALADRRADEPEIVVFAEVNGLEFAQHFGAVAAFRDAGDYPSWTARRRTAMRDAARAGNIVLAAPTPISRFLDWGQCVDAGSSEALLDRYASLMIEALVGDG